MTLDSIQKILPKCLQMKQIDSNNFQINAPIFYAKGKQAGIFLSKQGSSFFLCDKKQTLKYMNELYELGAKDVKSCINNVIKIYGFKISNGELLTEIKSENEFAYKIFDMFMCIGQLVNMYAFFDEPN